METIVDFVNANNERLFGILHAPDIDPESPRVAVILLTAGLHYRVGWHRLNVTLARRLCQKGFWVLRFDPHGVGDSEGELPDDTSMVRQHHAVQTGMFVPDARAATDYMINRCSPHHLYLAGPCGGSLTGLFAASLDTRVSGVVYIASPITLVSSYATSSKLHPFDGQATLGWYRSKLFRPRSWLRFLLGRSEYGAIKAALVSKLTRTTLTHEREDEGLILNPYFIDAFERYCASGRRIIFIFAELDRSTWEFNNLFRPQYLGSETPYQESCQVVTIRKTNHIFSSEEAQRTLGEIVVDWIRKDAGLNIQATERALTSNA